MGALLWAGLVALGVAVASMAVFAARLTRRHTGHAPAEEFIPSTDPDDPWSAYRPRPFDDVDRRRPRMWPAVAGVFGLVLVAGGVVGARQSTQLTTVDAAPTTRPYIVDVKTPPTPKPAPVSTPAPKVISTPHPVYVAAAPAPKHKTTVSPTSAGAPKISGFMSCSGGSLRVSIQVSGTQLRWFGLYVDGKVAKGGSLTGSSYSTSYAKPATHGDHTAEATADDKAGHHSRKLFTAHCA